MDPIINLMACNPYIKIQNKTTEYKILVLPVEKIITVHKAFVLGDIFPKIYTGSDVLGLLSQSLNAN